MAKLQDLKPLWPPKINHAWSMMTESVLKTMGQFDLGKSMATFELAAGVFNAKGGGIAATKAFEAFLESTTKRIAIGMPAHLEARLRGSVNLAAAQLEGISTTFIEFPEEVLSRGASGASFLNRGLVAFEVQQVELLNVESEIDEYDIEGLSVAAPTATIVATACDIIQLIARCNYASVARGVTPIFTVTSRMLEVSAGFCLCRVSDDATLGTLVDSLYCLIYEAAGAGKARFADKQGGPLTNAESTFAWKLKHLRNKWLGHDPGVGDEAANSRDLVDALKFFGLKGIPVRQSDFETLHHEILSEAQVFLRALLEKLNSPP